MITAVLIDDEKDANNVLSDLLYKFTNTEVKVLGMAENIDEGVKLINELKPDVVFLDIQLSHDNGLRIFDFFPKPEFKIIIVTAFKQYSIDAIKKSVSDYLLKPVSFLELQESIKKVSKLMEAEKILYAKEGNIGILNSPLVAGVKVLLDVESGFILVDSATIEYCYADQSYSVIVTNTGKSIVITKPLKELQAMLPGKHFYRTHKSYLVNIYYLNRFIRAGESFVQLKSGAKIPVSVRITSKIKNEIRQMLDI